MRDMHALSNMDSLPLRTVPPIRLDQAPGQLAVLPGACSSGSRRLTSTSPPQPFR